jgi:hypothetical protein
MTRVGHTPGPWAWFGNAKNNEVYLATTHSGRRYVMGFDRWGMRGAQPTFQPGERGVVPATSLFTFEVGNPDVRGVEQAKADDSVYRLDINGIDCADARLIAAAPDHALVGWAMCVGSARWEPWGDGRGEFCMNGLRHATSLDEFGIPIVTASMRAAIAKARGSDQS